jgi:hypothetical protein
LRGTADAGSRQFAGSKSRKHPLEAGDVKNASAVVERDGVHRRAPDDRQSDAPVARLRSQLSASTDKAAIRVGPSLH